MAASLPNQPLVDQLLHIDTLNNDRGGAQLMPLWSTPDGRVLALVAMADNGVPALQRAPQIGSAADWQWVDVTNFVSAGLIMRLNGNLSTHASFGQSTGAVQTYAIPAFRCAPLAGLSNADAACALNNPIGNPTRTGAFRFGSDWAIGNSLDLDLSYGLSWLHRDPLTPSLVQQQPAWDLLSGNTVGLPSVVIPGAELANVQNASVNALGRWHLNGTQSVDLGASLSRIQLSGLGNTPLGNFNQAALSFGLHYGSFSGMLTGRVLGPVDAINGNPRWSGLDVGISWRTPWQGEFSVGAQNLWSSGSLPSLNEPAAVREIDPNQARVPYVQYHQDL